MSNARTLTTRLATRMLRTRWFARAPIWLFRARLGFLFGHRLLMLEHVGRTSGLARYVALEVVARAGDQYTVAAGFGERAQWLRNVQAHPHAHISVGTRVRMPVVAHRLTTNEAADALRHYQAEHPRAWATLSPVFEQTLGQPVGASGAALPLVRFLPEDTASPPRTLGDPGAGGAERSVTGGDRRSAVSSGARSTILPRRNR